MREYRLLECKDGIKSTLVKGTEEEVIKYWNREKRSLVEWLLDSGNDRDRNNVVGALCTNVNYILDLEFILDTYLDYNWWSLEIEKALT